MGRVSVYVLDHKHEGPTAMFRRMKGAVAGLTWSDGDDSSSNEATMRHSLKGSPVTLPGDAERNGKVRPLRDAGKTSTRQSVLNLVNCILGAGILGYPYCFKASGLVLTTCIMVVSLAACRFSYQLLLYATQLSSKRSYEDLAEQAVGKIGKHMVSLCTAAVNLGSIVAYLNILADVLSAVAGTLIPPGAEPSRSVYLIGVSLFGALPVALIVRDHAVVAAFSTASVGFMMLFTSVIIMFACMPPPAAAATGVVQLWHMDGLLVAFPIIAYSFTAHPYYLGIYNNMHTSSTKRMVKVTDMAMGVAALLYWLVGMAGYVTFKGRTAGDLLRNFGAAHVTGLRGAYERAIKLCFGLSILGSIPLVILPFYNILLPIMGFGPMQPGGSDHRANKHRLSDDEEEDVAHAVKRPGSIDSTTSRSTRASALGTPSSGGRSMYTTDVVDLKLHHDGLHSPRTTGDEDFMPSPGQHSLIVGMVLGLAMASAVWIPNVEFIFGLTGSTASVFIAYIMPAITFIRLLDQQPELTAQGGSAHVSGAGPGKLVVVPQEVRVQWVWRRRKAMVLLIFGLVSAISCTDAILGAVKEEAAVVQLAQQLVAHEAVVVETTRAQKKAKEAVAAVSVVQTASKQLDAAQANATSTLGKLQQAADALSSIAHHNNSGEGARHAWDITGAIKERNQHANENKVLKSVEAVLASVQTDIRKTRASVESVVGQLDGAIAQIKSGAAAGNSTSAAGAATAAAATIPGGARVADLATELGKALGTYNVVQNGTAGKSLEQVRANAANALMALDQTLAILTQVEGAVEVAKRDHKHDKAHLRDVAVHAMQAALNATATSALAMRMTTDALARSASEETDELLSILTQVASDLQKSKSKSVAGKAAAVAAAAKADDKAKAAAAAASGATSTGTGASGTTDKGGAAASGATAAGATASITGAGGVAATGTSTGGATAVGEGKDAAGAAGPSGSTKSQAGAGGTSAATGQGSKAKDGGAAGAQSGAGGARTEGTVGGQVGGQAGMAAGGAAAGGAAGAGAGVGGGAAQGGATSTTDAAAGAATATGAATGAGSTTKQKADALKKVIQDLKGIVGDAATANTTAAAAGGAAAGSAAAGSTPGTAVGGSTIATGGAAGQAGTGTTAGQTGGTGAGGSKAKDVDGSQDTSTTPGTSSKTDAGQATGGAAATSTSTSTATGTTATGTGAATAGDETTTATGTATTTDTKSTGAVGGAATAGATAAATANTTAAAAAAGDEDKITAEDVENVASVLQDAVALTEGTKNTVIKEIQDTLGKANTKVQERVVGILKDMKETKAATAAAGAKVTVMTQGEGPGGSTTKDRGTSPKTQDSAPKVLDATKKAASDQSAAAKAGGEAAAGAGTGGGGGEGTSTASVSTSAAGMQDGSKQGATGGGAKGVAAGAGTGVWGQGAASAKEQAEEDAAVIGPVVLVDDKGQLHQKEEEETGPVVTQEDAGGDKEGGKDGIGKGGDGEEEQEGEEKGREEGGDTEGREGTAAGSKSKGDALNRKFGGG